MIQPTKKQRPRNKRFSPLHCGSKEQLVAVPLQTDRDHCPLRAPNNKGDVPNRISTLLQRFACARLSQSCLSKSCSDFSATFTTIAFDDSSLRWLEIST